MRFRMTTDYSRAKLRVSQQSLLAKKKKQQQNVTLFKTTAIAIV